jgi:hypothetical protein
MTRDANEWIRHPAAAASNELYISPFHVYLRFCSWVPDLDCWRGCQNVDLGYIRPSFFLRIIKYERIGTGCLRPQNKLAFGKAKLAKELYVYILPVMHSSIKKRLLCWFFHKVCMYFISMNLSYMYLLYLCTAWSPFPAHTWKSAIGWCCIVEL